MTSQNLLKFLSLLSLIATISAIVIWRETGEAPSPWLIRTAIAGLAAALVVFVINVETRPRIMLQFLAALFAILALFAFAADFTSTSATVTGFHSLSLLERITGFAPSLRASVQASVTRALGPAAWDPVLTGLLGLPAYLVFAILAAFCGFAGRPRREVRIFAN
jgi:hypothetical protein